MIGEVLGNRYELLEKIGEGGMSIVYKARCNKLNRFVAVKILKSEFCDNEEIVKKFKIEATAIATLSDTNIVNVLDVGTQDNLNYIVMEYVKGKTLKQVIRQFGALNYESAITIALQMVKALDCAHRNGIIHRDVKPQNILVSEDGLVKVTDFGIAKSTASTTLTNTTTIMGSAHYFSPEQAKGVIVDVRTDLYSLGVVIYEMVTGRVPFEAESPVTIALKHIQEEVVAPKSINSKIPDSLNELILNLMSKDPKDRYQTAKDLMVDLQKIKEDPNAILSFMKISETPKEEGQTIVMSAVNTAEINNSKQVSIDDDDDYYDDDYYDEDYDYYEDDEYRNIKKKRTKRIIIGILVGIVAIVGVFLGAFFAFSGSDDTKENDNKVLVPEIKGLTLEQAKVALEREDLVLVEAGTEKSEEEEGTIIDLDPNEGAKVEKGSKIRVITSSGPDKIKMPNFKESDVDTVKKFFKENDITDVEYKEIYSDIEVGYVIYTDPGVGAEIDEDTSVVVYLSIGPEIKYFDVIDVTGLSYSEAKSILENDGFVVKKETKEVNEENKQGVVVSQTDIGASKEEGSTITLTVGEYVAPKPVEKTLNVDDIQLRVGQTLEAARSAIKDAAKQAGITVNIKEELHGAETGSGSYIIVDWYPYGKELTNGESITIYYEERPSNVDTPTE